METITISTSASACEDGNANHQACNSVSGTMVVVPNSSLCDLRRANSEDFTSCNDHEAPERKQDSKRRSFGSLTYFSSSSDSVEVDPTPPIDHEWFILVTGVLGLLLCQVMILLWETRKHKKQAEGPELSGQPLMIPLLHPPPSNSLLKNNLAQSRSAIDDSLVIHKKESNDILSPPIRKASEPNLFLLDDEKTQDCSHRSNSEPMFLTEGQPNQGTPHNVPVLCDWDCDTSTIATDEIESLRRRSHGTTVDCLRPGQEGSMESSKERVDVTAPTSERLVPKEYTMVGAPRCPARRASQAGLLATLTEEVTDSTSNGDFLSDISFGPCLPVRRASNPELVSLTSGSTLLEEEGCRIDQRQIPLQSAFGYLDRFKQIDFSQSNQEQKPKPNQSANTSPALPVRRTSLAALEGWALSDLDAGDQSHINCLHPGDSTMIADSRQGVMKRPERRASLSSIDSRSTKGRRDFVDSFREKRQRQDCSHEQRGFPSRVDSRQLTIAKGFAEKDGVVSFHRREENETEDCTKSVVSALTMTTTMTTMTSRSYGSCDFFPCATVLIASVAGLAEWSSARPPGHVFNLLEKLFQDFEQSARNLEILKVDTVTDSFMAVAGVIEARSDHALRIVQFARKILQDMVSAVKDLERVYGNGTGELRLLIGVNSGPLLVDFIHGRDRMDLDSRSNATESFPRIRHIFGPSVRVASEMEATCLKHRIQISEATADLLQSAGKKTWIRERESGRRSTYVESDEIAKTYWVVTANQLRTNTAAKSLANPSSIPLPSYNARNRLRSRCANNQKNMVTTKHGDCDSFLLSLPAMSRTAKKHRLVDWAVQIFLEAINLIRTHGNRDDEAEQLCLPILSVESGFPIIEEVADAVCFKRHTCHRDSFNEDTKEVRVDSKIGQQLQALIAQVADEYNDENPYHSFEHAVQALQSVQKLLSRCLWLIDEDYDKWEIDSSESSSHQYMLDLAHDPLSQFAILFAALVHDIGESGQSNRQLISLKPDICHMYGGESVAEQLSVKTAWDILMDQSCYPDLQRILFQTKEDMIRFRQILVNAVLATDFFNESQQERRHRRWVRAFCTSDNRASREEDVDLKATIVLESLVQASDISHTMQPWPVFQQWNERLFQEKCVAFDKGILDNDPVETWYEEEKNFFDKYVMPLANRLAEAKVFGVSSCEYLDHALENQKRWSETGHEVVQRMYARYQKRKDMEVGGLTEDEINNLTPQELEDIMRRLVVKGQDSGSKSVGKIEAAQAWLDALEIYERSPVATDMEDRAILFPIYSGISAWLKGGKIQQDRKGYFETNLALKFVEESKLHPNPIHYLRALAMLAEVCGRRGKCKAALTVFKKLAGIYDVEKHSMQIADVYGGDRAAQAFSFSALWHRHLGNVGQARAACEHVIEEVLPKQDPSSTLGNFALVLNIVAVLKEEEPKRMHDLLDKYVISPFREHHGPNGFTPCMPLFKPLVWLLRICHDPTCFCDLNEAVDWAIEGNNAVPNDFLDNIVSSHCWSASDMTAELCLRLQQQLDVEGRRLQEQKLLIQKGLFLARRAEQKLRDPEGRIKYPLSMIMHGRIMQELEDLAKRKHLLRYVEEPPPPAPGLDVNLPRSYLRAPDIPL